jgi:hypothetical protein
MIKLKDLLKEVEAKKPDAQITDLDSTTNAVLDFVSKSKTELKKLVSANDYDGFYKLGFDKFPAAKQGDVAQAMNAAAVAEGWFAAEDVPEMPTEKDLEQAAFGDKKLQKGVDTAAYDKLAKLPKNPENIKESFKKKGKLAEMANTESSKVDSFLNTIKSTIKNARTNQQIRDFIMIARLDPYASFKSLLSDLMVFYDKNTEVLKIVKVALQTESVVNEDFEDDVESIKKAPLATAVDKIRNLIKDPDFKDKIKAGEFDGAKIDEVVSFGSSNIKCTKMFPTQAEIGFDNSLADIVNDQYGAIDSAFTNPVLMPAAPKKIPILTARIGSDIAILDGHHRWSLCFMINPEAEMECDIMETPSGYTAEDALKIMQLAIGAEAGKVVTKPFNGKDLMAVATNEVIKYITENIGEKEIATFAKYKPELNSKETIAAHVGEAHKKIVNMKGPFPRTIMPQAGDSGTSQVAVNKALEKGEININAPFKKESVNKRRDSMLKESILNLK